MRFYGFGNYYLSALQQGLQASHVVTELFINYRKESEENRQLFDWAENHKTMVFLNGGNSKSLKEIHELFIILKSKGMKLPFAKFNEDEDSLGGALTYVGIIVPEKYYSIASYVRKLEPFEQENYFTAMNLEDWESTLIKSMNQYSLA